jgi:HD-GYP domain-containing protein (c-di-GMP phosphodiesterase class II)
MYRKKIDARDLQLGMYVYELDRPWIETPFLFQGFELKSNSIREKIIEMCKYVWIDVQRGADISPKTRSGAEAMARMQILEKEQKRIDTKVRALATQQDVVHPTFTGRPPYQDQTPLEEEIRHARTIEKETRETMRSAFHGLRHGKSLDINLAGKAVTRMVDSVIRNPDALVCLSQLKEVSEYTALHSIRCSILAMAFGRHLAMSKDELQDIGMGTLLHDIGMAKIPEEILAKTSGLTESEFQIMTQHTRLGQKMVVDAGGAPPAAMEIILQHHERGGGGGYPDHLKGANITLAGYIGAIVDVYDAVTSDRTYNTALSAEDALKRMYEWRYKEFNPKLMEEFIRCMGIYPIGSLVELSTGSVGVVITINRYRRLKPKVALVLTASKTPYSQRIVNDLMEHRDVYGQEIKITQVLPAGSYGITPMDHIVQL